MSKKSWAIIVFIISLVSLVISVCLFWNLGVYVDEYNTSPDIVFGSYFWLLMNWLRLLLIFMIALISGIRLFRFKDNKR